MELKRGLVSTSLIVGALLLLLALPAQLRAADADRFWPSWRGPLSTGVAPHADPPIRWSETENLRWKVKVPGLGSASPVVWGDRVFLLSAVSTDLEAYEASQQAAAEKIKRRQWPPSVEPVRQQFVILALAREDGRVLWQRTATERVPNETHHLDNTWASGSPVTDGEVVVAHFGSHGTYAYDLDGKLLWQRDLGDMTTRRGFGEGSSPSLYGDRVIINWDHEGESFLVALDRLTGSELWRTPRPGEITSWATPLIVQQGSRHQIIVPATGKSRGYDLETGQELWSLGGMTANTIPSPVERDGVVYLASGFRGNILQAVDLERASGEVEGTEALLWTHTRHTPYVPSLLLYENQLYFLKTNGNILTSLRADTGEVLYTEMRLDGISGVFSSPVGAAGRVYIVGREGKSVVLRQGPKLEVLASNTLDERFDTTPALVDGEIYLRGQKFMYCLAVPDN